MKEEKPYEDAPRDPEQERLRRLYGGNPRIHPKTPRERMMQTHPRNMDIKNAADDPLEIGFDVLKAMPCPVCGAIGREIGMTCPAQKPAVICPVRKKETNRAARGRNMRVVGREDEPMTLDEMRDAFVVRRSERMCDICHKEPALPNHRVCKKHHDAIKGMQDAMGLGKSEEFKHGDRVKSWAGVGTISYIRGDKVKLNLEDGTRSKFLNMSDLEKV